MIELPTLLVITDQPPIRYWIKKQLDSRFFIIDAATEKKALETVQTSHLNFVILDDVMENAMELCQKIRTLGDFPILLITGHLKKSYRDAALKAGVTSFLSDLLDADELNAQIEASKNTKKMQKKMKHIFVPSQTEATSSLKDKALQANQNVLVVQIDEFEKLPCKEEILEACANLIQATPSDKGQFIILANGDARKMAENLQKTVAERVFDTKQGKVRITVSVAVSKTDVGSFNKIIHAANKSLKKPQKNTIFFIDQEFLG